MSARRFGAAVVVAAACLATFGTSAASAALPSLFARMTGAQEVPGPGDANGRAAALIDAKVGPSKVCVGVRHRNIAAPSAMHIHSGAVGVPGPIVVDLTPVLGGTKCVAASKPLVRDIRDNPGNYYINIHNGAFPDGAIRGQLESSLVASSFMGVSGLTHPFARMSGSQEVPGPGDANGTGATFIDLKPGAGEVCVDERYQGIDTPNAMHIHAGATGVPGGIVVNLTPALAGDVRCVTADPVVIRDIRDDATSFYCNIHTGPFPDGAIRGQLEPSS